MKKKFLGEWAWEFAVLPFVFYSQHFNDFYWIFSLLVKYEILLLLLSRFPHPQHSTLLTHPPLLHPFFPVCAGGLQFEEDRIYRHLEPALAFQLELNRMRNFDLTAIPCANHKMHLYLGAAKVEVGTEVTDYRFFVRAIIRHSDLVTKVSFVTPCKVSLQDSLWNSVNRCRNLPENTLRAQSTADGCPLFAHAGSTGACLQRPAIPVPQGDISLAQVGSQQSLRFDSVVFSLCSSCPTAVRICPALVCIYADLSRSAGSVHPGGGRETGSVTVIAVIEGCTSCWNWCRLFSQSGPSAVF